MFYLTTHSTHFILRLYGVRHLVKDYSDSEKENPLPPHGLFFPISSKGFFNALSHKQDSTYHSLYYSIREVLAGKRNSLMDSLKGIHPTTHCTMSGRSTTELHLAPRNVQDKNNFINSA